MKATINATTTVTREQIERCTRIIDLETMLPFYMVESESDSTQEYKVSTIYRNGAWHIICTCPAGLDGFAHCKDTCKHVVWARAAAAEYKQELAEAARLAAEQAPAITTPAQTVVKVEYTDVDAQTLARIQRRDAERKERKPDTRKVAYCQTRPAGFSLMK